MDGDFFQLLRRVQKEERNKSTLARVEKDFYKKLYSYIRALERSVADNPFDVDQSILLNNAQRIATEICETRESKISSAANTNIYRSFHLFKKENPQFDLLDTTPLNLTDEEETLYFSLMDALRTHRYNISLDKFGEEKSNSGAPSGYIDNQDNGGNDDLGQYDDSILESRVNPGVVSEEEFFGDDDNSNQSVVSESTVSNESGQSGQSSSSTESNLNSGFESQVGTGSSADGSLESHVDVSSGENESDEVLNRLNQIKNATVIDDEKYEPIEKQINNQAKVVPNVSMENNLEISPEKSDVDKDLESGSTQKSINPSPKPIEERPKSKSASTLDFDSIFANPDSQFADLGAMEPDYDADFANIEASTFAQPNDADLVFSTRPKTKKDSSGETPQKGLDNPQAETSLMDSSNAQDETSVMDPSNAQDETSVMDPSNAQAEAHSKAESSKSSSKSIKSIAKKEEIENTAVVIFNDMESIVGVDEKVYGPFLAKDVVILPNITAQILIDNNKAGLIDL